MTKARVKTLTRLLLFLLRTYFRVEVRGLENIPQRGRALITPNHSGFAGFDAVLLAYVIKRETKRRARLLAHRAYFDFSKVLRDIAEQFGLRKASIEEGVRALNSNHLMVVFPEGEKGNFKPTLKRYRLQEFHTGFLRMALETGSPVVPCVILGAEEASLSFGNLNLSKLIKGLRIPLPVNFMPLPSKWRIVFLPAIQPDEWKAPKTKSAQKKATARFQKKMQKEIDALLKERQYIYSRRLRKVLNRVTA